MLSCREATRLMSEQRERPLGVAERLSLAVHHGICAGCREFGRQTELLGAAMRRFAGGAGEGSADNPDDPDPK